MGDRCYLQITMRREDLPKFGGILGCAPDETWWDNGYDEECNEDLVTVSVYETNYGWTDDREAAAKEGLVFFGDHDPGGTYGPCAFAAVDGRHMESPLDFDGNLIIPIDDELKPVIDLESVRAFVAHRRKAEIAIGYKVKPCDEAGS